MDIRMGSDLFSGVAVPILWGTRAILQDKKCRISVIDLSGTQAKLEILGDKPAPKIQFRPSSDGSIEIMDEGIALYSFDARNKTLRGLELLLPECEIAEHEIRVGTFRIRNTELYGFGVGVRVNSKGVIGIGVALPPELAKLRV